jgi:hypothetical protein
VKPLENGEFEMKNKKNTPKNLKPATETTPEANVSKPKVTAEAAKAMFADPKAPPAPVVKPPVPQAPKGNIPAREALAAPPVPAPRLVEGMLPSPGLQAAPKSPPAPAPELPPPAKKLGDAFGPGSTLKAKNGNGKPLQTPPEPMAPASPTDLEPKALKVVGPTANELKTEALPERFAAIEEAARLGMTDRVMDRNTWDALPKTVKYEILVDFLIYTKAYGSKSISKGMHKGPTPTQENRDRTKRAWEIARELVKAKGGTPQSNMAEAWVKLRAEEASSGTAASPVSD